MGSLSAALLTINSFDGYDAGRVDLERRQRTNRTRAGRDEDGSKNGAIRRRDTLGFIEHITFTHHVSGTSLLVSWGLEEGSLDDFYTACCAGSFYSGVLTTVISSVLVRTSVLVTWVLFLGSCYLDLMIDLRMHLECLDGSYSNCKYTQYVTILSRQEVKCVVIHLILNHNISKGRN